MRAVLIVVTIVILVITGTALALGWEGAFTRRRDPVTVDAYVEGDRTPLSSHLSGYVRTVLVRDNQLVHAGDTIVQMVDDDYRAKAAEAQAQTDASRAALAALEEKREVLRAAGGTGARWRDRRCRPTRPRGQRGASPGRVAAHGVGAVGEPAGGTGLPAAGGSDTGAGGGAGAGEPACRLSIWTRGSRNGRRKSARPRRRARSPGSRWAIPASSRRSTARWVSARCAKAHCCRPVPRSTQ